MSYEEYLDKTKQKDSRESWNMEKLAEKLEKMGGDKNERREMVFM